MKTKLMLVVMLVSVLLVGCTTTSTVYVPTSAPVVSAQPSQQVQSQVVNAPVPYGYGNGAARVRVSTGRLFGIIPYTSSSTSWSYHVVEPPVYVAPPVDIYYSYPSFSAGFEWRSGRLDRHRTWGPHQSRQPDCRPNHGNQRGGHGRR